MGGGVFPTQLPFLFFVVLFSFFGLLFADPDSRKTPPPNDIDVIAPSNAFPSPVSNLQQRRDAAPFRPTIAVIVGVLTTLFSVTFLLLLYAKHCKRGNSHSNSSGGAGLSTVSARKNSGIDRAVIESLPIFRFGSLSGQKDGLECAVCLTRFETTEVLRLLPKCKHAFHVECVDTWLDAHSTCPLCRYRVEPEDILLIEDAKIHHENQLIPPPPPRPPPPPQPEPENPSLKPDDESRRSGTVSESRPREDSTSTPGYRRMSGRHSSAGERTSEFLQIVMHRPTESEREPGSGCSEDPASFRRSLDSSSLRKKNESVAVGCFDRQHRKDGLLLADGMVSNRTSFERRFEHRIIVSAGPRNAGFHQRWSDVQPSDLLYLRSEMIISDSRRFSSGLGSRPQVRRQQHQNMQLPLYSDRRGGQVEERGSTDNNYEHRRSSGSSSGRNVINTRSVSEITGLSRFATRGSNNSNNHQHRERQAGAISRWLAWVSSQSQPAVRSERTVAVV